MKNPFKKEKPRKVLRVRVQHRDMDHGAIDGLWVGEYNGYLHLRAVSILIAGADEKFRHEEILLPAGKILYMEVLGSDANPDPSTHEIGEPA